jgi:hypothetical protein
MLKDHLLTWKEHHIKRFRLRLPILVKVDNDGDVYLRNKNSYVQRFKHIDIRSHFVREFVEDGIVTTEFVGTDINEADISAKYKSE